MNPYEAVIQCALSWVGTTEATGHNDGPEVEMFQQAVDGVAQGEAWCMAFSMFCIGQAEQSCGVVSSIFRAEHCLTVWNNSQHLAVATPYPGCIAIWQHGNTTSGHTGIITGVDEAGGYFTTVEGNTSGGGEGIEREGEGVYEKSRNFYGSGSMKLVGFLDPFLS